MMSSFKLYGLSIMQTCYSLLCDFVRALFHVLFYSYCFLLRLELPFKLLL